MRRIWLAAALWAGSCSSPLKETTSVDPAELPALPVLMEATSPVRGPQRAPVDVRIALVGEVRGELEPCGCPTVPYGGFGRRGRLLERLRGEGPLFHLDAGELAMKGFATDRARDLKRRAHTTLELSKLVGVDLWVPGPSDLLALGSERIRKEPGPKRISATWVDRRGQLMFPPVAVLEKSGIRLGVIGLSAAPIDSDEPGVTTRDPIEAAKAAVLLLPDDTDLNIALGNVSDDAAVAIARQVPGLAAVLTVRGGEYDKPSTSRVNTQGGTPIIEVPDRGRYIQLLTVRVGTDAGTPVELKPEARAWRERGQQDTESAEFAEMGRGRNLGFATTIPLGSDLDGKGPVEHSLRSFKQVSLAEAARRAAQAPPRAEPYYASSGSCVRCHSSEFARWSLSAHAKAWPALLERNDNENPECLPCHTTGWGEPSGLGELTASAVRKFKSVQCEACHGPMGGHPHDGRVRSHPISDKTCQGCHDAANSPSFDYASYLAQATCQGGSPHSIKP